MARSVSVALIVGPVGAWALIWAGPGVAPTSVVIGKLTLSSPAGTVTEAGTVAPG